MRKKQKEFRKNMAHNVETKNDCTANKFSKSFLSLEFTIKKQHVIDKNDIKCNAQPFKMSYNY